MGDTDPAEAELVRGPPQGLERPVRVSDHTAAARDAEPDGRPFQQVYEARQSSPIVTLIVDIHDRRHEIHHVEQFPGERARRLEDGALHHVECHLSGDAAKWYVDGKRVGRPVKVQWGAA